MAGLLFEWYALTIVALVVCCWLSSVLEGIVHERGSFSMDIVVEEEQEEEDGDKVCLLEFLMQLLALSRRC